MSRPLGFPRPLVRLGVLCFVVFILPFLLFLPADLWLNYSLPPLQKQYLAAYMGNSILALQGNPKGSIRWMLKTAPGRRPEAVAADDVVEGQDHKFPLQLSASAKEAGWRGLTRSAPQSIPAAELDRGLQDEVYDGASMWWLFGKPILATIAGLVLLWGLWARPRGGGQANESRHGRRTKGPEMARSRQLNFFRRDDGIRLRLQGENGLGRMLPFGPTYQVPRRLESSHILLMGDTGSGKSSAIRQILQQVQARGESAIVYDPAMEFVGEFYSADRGDLILNPLDARCPYWNLGEEVRRDETAATMAAAFLPDKEYEKAFFTDAPRRILNRMFLRRPQPRDVLRWMSDPEQLMYLLQGTPLAALIDPAAPAQRAGVLSSLNLVADSFELLPEWEHTRKTFSTAEWYTERKRWVFLTSKPEYREKILPLHSVWLDLLILRMQGGCEDREAKPVWFVLDELASLNKLPQLHTAVTENRKYGNPVVLGFQGRSQMEKRYGQDAEAMLSQPATKIFFKTSEPRAAKWISESIGEIEVERLKESRAMGLLRSKRSYAMEIATKPLVMASEIAGLAPLRAFIKQENRVVPVRFRFTRKRSLQPQFIERKLPLRESSPERQPVIASSVSAPANKPLSCLQIVTSAPAVGLDSVKKPTAVQKELPLAPPVSTTEQPAFVWNEAQGID